MVTWQTNTEKRFDAECRSSLLSPRRKRRRRRRSARSEKRSRKAGRRGESKKERARRYGNSAVEILTHRVDKSRRISLLTRSPIFRRSDRRGRGNIDLPLSFFIGNDNVNVNAKGNELERVA